MKKALIFSIAFALVCSAGIFSLSNAQVDKGPEFIKITDGTNSSANPAYFPHRDHQERLNNDCGTCHHGRSADDKQVKYADAEEPKSRKCHTCHNKDGITLEGKISGVPLLLTSPIQRAGHGRCGGCHKDQKSTRGTNLMICTTCHNMYKDKVE
ncbi:MAG: hypothetical protein D3920_07060 [Candidatus Electrothrix sp. AW2]|jgi:uncharacterized protein YxeA|nr:hypothetical protein [Candidatus Electrothrix sp. AX1]MCI5134824.1 hypothetical protein [Candidatus Electrothrix gigas]MCI5178530.1 hypothetical protein [Candidatus Electrothrix gigas]MCI5183022.1 hypothetical protein [Candidatus Electrothrix gigas]MCI5196492.1 hypothetical protein [Candidatus Electrothrix gigas]